MSRYRNIHCLIWNDDKFPFLSERAKLVFFHVLTTPFGNPFGAFKMSVAGLAEEARIPLKGYREGLRELFEKGMVKHDERVMLIFIPNFIKHNRPANPNVVQKWAGIFKELPDCELKNEVFAILFATCKGLGEPFLKRFEEWFREPTPKGTGIQEQEQEQDKEEYMSTIPIADLPANGHCPHEKIIALYHQTLPVLPRVRVWTDARKKHLASRWKEDAERQNLAWWEKFFAYIGTCRFLTGKTTGRDGRSFLASLDWIVLPENFVKIIEGKYE